MNKLRNNFIYNTMYQLLIIIVPIITAPYISRHLGASNLGVFSYVNANITYFLLIANLGFNICGQNEIAKSRDNLEERSKVFWHLVIAKIIFTIISFTLFLFTNNLFIKQNDVVYLILAYQIIASAFDISWFYMGIENFKITVMRNLIIKLLTTILIFTVIHKPTDLIKYVLIIVISTFIGNLSIWIGINKHVRLTAFNFSYFYVIIKNSLVLFIPTIAISLYTSLNRTFIGMFDSKVDVAYFVQADSLIKVVLAVVTSLGTVMMPHVSNMIAKGLKDEVSELIYKSYGLMTYISIPIMFLIVIVATRFSTWFLGDNFKPVGQLLIIESITIILIAWSNVLGMQYLVPNNKLKQFSASVSIPAIISVVITPILTIVYKVNGAMLSTVITELLVIGIQLFFTRNDLEIKSLFSTALKPVIIGFIMLTLLIIFNKIMYINNTFIFLITDAIVGAIIYLLGSLIFRVPYLNITKLLAEKNELE